MIDALLDALRLKAVPRTGWLRRGVADPEDVASHSWGLAFLVLILLPDDLDRARALEYAVLHDLAEVSTGDITPHDGISRDEKHRREREAMEELCARLPRGAELLATWNAYEARTDPEAQFVHQLDRLDMALQATAYHRAGAVGMAEFLDSARQVISDPSLITLLDQLSQRVSGTAE